MTFLISNFSCSRLAETTPKRIISSKQYGYSKKQLILYEQKNTETKIVIIHRSDRNIVLKFCTTHKKVKISFKSLLNFCRNKEIIEEISFNKSQMNMAEKNADKFIMDLLEELKNEKGTKNHHIDLELEGYDKNKDNDILMKIYNKNYANIMKLLMLIIGVSTFTSDEPKSKIIYGLILLATAFLLKALSDGQKIYLTSPIYKEHDSYTKDLIDFFYNIEIPNNVNNKIYHSEKIILNLNNYHLDIDEIRKFYQSAKKHLDEVIKFPFQ